MVRLCTERFFEREFPLTTFEGLGLTDSLLRAVGDEGYHTATPIQLQAIPPVLAGRDLMGCAQTGTGKTAAFALPTLQRLAADGIHHRGGGTPPAKTVSSFAPRRSGQRHHKPARDYLRAADRPPIRALILAPTRELAAQIGESFETYGRHTGLRSTVVYGGVGQKPQVRAIQSGVDILIATPGRLLDLMEQGYVDLRRIKILILDEADQMLDMGFIIPLRRIVRAVPQARQTLMFSATMPPEIKKLAGEWLRDPVHVQVAPVATPAELVAQSVYFVEPRHKPELLAHFLMNTECTRALVFARTKHGADKIVKQLGRNGIRAAAIHGNKSQTVRERTLAEFKSKKPPVLVATDIAARGLDIDDISHVINYELPNVPEIYVHRIGRTGRAGATGVATSFCGREERGLLRDIERLTRKPLVVEENQPKYSKEPATHYLAADGERSHGHSRTRGRRPRRGSSQQSGHASDRPVVAASVASRSGASPAKRRRRPGGRRYAL
jgi:ATP-dependent RNA helicase RhlE